MATYSSILAWEFHGQRSLMGYSPWGHKELDMTEKIAFSLSYTYIYIHVCICVCVYFTSSQIGLRTFAWELMLLINTILNLIFFLYL